MGKRRGSTDEEHEAKRARSSASPTTTPQAPTKGNALLLPTQPSTSAPSAAAPTGLTLANATLVMSGYIGSLRNNMTLHNAVYEVSDVPPPGSGFQCTLKLPHNAPVRESQSTGQCNSKMAAKASAAFHAICALYAAGEITSTLELTPKNPSLTNRGAAGGRQKVTKSATAGTNTYGYIASSKFWDESRPLTKHAFGSVVQLCMPGHPEVDSKCRRLLLVTASSLPSDSPVTVDVGQAGADASMTFYPSHRLKLSGRKQQLEKAHEYTLELLRSAHGRKFSAKLEQSSYVMLPLSRSFRGLKASPDDIDWDEVEAISQPWTTVSGSQSQAELDKQVQDKVAVTDEPVKLRLYLGDVRPDLDPTLAHPSERNSSIASVYTPLAAKLRLPAVSSVHSQIVEATLYSGPKTFGVVGSASSLPEAVGSSKIYVPIVGLRLHPISASTIRTTSTLAEALAGLDTHLLATELSNQIFKGRLQPTLTRQAITSPSARPTAGVDNYERLEMLGDTLLKFVVGVDCYTKTWSNQGDMSQARHQVVSNNALRASLLRSGIPPYIRVRYRAAKDFVPPGWDVEGKNVGVPTDQVVGDKVLADVCEALIGAAYLTSGRKLQAALDAMHTMFLDIKVTDWSTLKRTTPPPAACAQPTWNDRRNSDASRPLTVLGYKFHDPRKGRIVLSMRHVPARRAEFERYEFLGDALLDYLTVETLWDDHPDQGPGPLTHMKHSRVGNATFSAFLAISGLINQLIDVPDATVTRLRRFSSDIYAAQRRADDLIASGDPEYEFWASVPEHKAFGDTLEALFGAIYDDSGFDLETVKSIYKHHLLPFVRKYSVPPHGHSLHPKSALLEMMAKKGCREFKVEYASQNVPGQQASGATVILHGRTYGEAVAPSQSLAARNACAEALRGIRKQGGLDVLCDCKK